MFKRKLAGTLACHLLQDMKVPGSNINKDLKLIKLEMMQDLGDLNYTPYCFVWAIFSNIRAPKASFGMWVTASLISGSDPTI